jgi:hypothetical protein
MSDDETFPPGLPEADRARWSMMTPAQRSKARARLAAFQAWTSDEMGIDEAVKASGLSRSRFYRLAAEWRSAPSLAALGAFTGGGAARQRLDSDAVNALQSVVPDVVRLNADASVSQLVRLMIERAGVPEDKLPGTIRLRNIVENELRRVAATGEAGHAVRFDCTAINIPRHNGRPFVMFACIDVGTRLILGIASSEEALAAVGYPAAAEDARRRIAAMRDRLPWALRLTRAEITAGVDVDDSVDLVEALRAEGVRANVQLARVDKRFGRYFRASVGERIGRIAITPGRTTAGQAMPDNGDMSPWKPADAAAALATAVDDYNMSILTELSAAPRGIPPHDLILTLNVLTKG